MTVAVVLTGSRAYLPGLEVTLTSLMLANPGLEADVIVVHPDLEPGDLDRLALRHPRVRGHRVPADSIARLAAHHANPHRASHVMAALHAASFDAYSRVIVLDADLLVIGDVRDLLEAPGPYAAVTTGRESQRPRRGVLVLAPGEITPAQRQALATVRESGDYQHADDEAGVIAAVLGAPGMRLSSALNVDKRRVTAEQIDAGEVRIIHFAGRFKPWQGGEHGFEAVEELWDRGVVHPVVYWRTLASDPRAGAELQRFADEHARRFTLLSDDDLADLDEARRSARGDGDFARAFQAAQAAALGNPTVTAEQALELGLAAMATSRAAIARTALTVAAGDEALAGRAETALAQLEWTYRDYDAAAAAATEAMRARPGDLQARRLLERIERTRAEDSVIADGDGPAIGHIAFYVDSDGNYGDVLLPVAVRASLEDALGPVRWSTVHAHQVFDIERARWANEHLDALVVGGGGLFLPDTSPNGNSGWQWNVTDEALEALTIPLVVYTVGYNLFPGQRFHGTRFAESVRTLVRHAAFVGLRNHGSVAAVKEVVGPDLADKVDYLPCVTTVYGQLAGVGAPAHEAASDADLPVVLLNIAYDRRSLRFGDGYRDLVARLAELVRSLEGRSEIRCLAHTREDERIVADLRRWEDVVIGTDAVYGDGAATALDTIGRAAVVIGMRGHASMIPFGIGVPIVSLISHAKLRYFLEDIGHVEWGVDIDDPALAERLASLVDAVLAEPDAVRGEVAEAQERLRAVVDAANARIRTVIEQPRMTP